MRFWALTFLLIIASGAAQAGEENIEIRDVWITPNDGSHVEFYDCTIEGKNGLCGRLLWVDEPGAKDVLNPDPALRDRLLKGIDIFLGFREDRPGVWEDGIIYDPEAGTFHGDESIDLILRVEGDELQVQGCFLFFCQSETFTRMDEYHLVHDDLGVSAGSSADE